MLSGTCNAQNEVNPVMSANNKTQLILTAISKPSFKPHKANSRICP